jgi:energy-coupling factor transport system permease protein
MIQEYEHDPRDKLVIVMCLSTIGVVVQNIYILVLTLLTSLIANLLFKCSIFSIIKKMKRILYLLVFVSLLQSIFSPSGNVLLGIGKLSIITSGGLYKGILMLLRMTIIISSAAILTTSSSRKIVQGLVQWKVPYEIAFMVSIAVRFLPILSNEIKDTMTALQLRGIELDKIPFGKKIKVYSYLLTPVVIGTILKSQELSTAIEMRAFRAYPQRTSYLVLKLKHKDYAIIISSITLCVFLFISSLSIPNISSGNDICSLTVDAKICLSGF